MPRKEPRILLDAEILVRLAYLTITGETDLKALETLRHTYGQGGIQIAGEKTPPEGLLELTPLEELRRFFEEALGSSEGLSEEGK
ncbi:MAG: hypothetical protein ACUVUS_08265 [Thermoproteota archaeon]